MPEQEPPIGTAVVDQVPKVFRLESIKSRIVGLALLATLIPSLAMAWISYVQNRAALTERIDEELQSVGAQAAREIDLWFKERLYDVRVFASSYLVSENIERALQADDGGQAGALDDYLTSVGERFPDYNELIVIDHQGERLATSAERAGKVHLTSDWLDRVAAGQAVIGDAYFDEGFGEPLMTVAVPVTAADQAFVGVNDLIEKDSMASPEKIDRLQHRIRNLLDCPELSLGLIAFDRRANVEAIEGARAVGKSLLLCEECAPTCPNRANSHYAGVFQGRDPVIVQDLKTSALRTGYEHHLRKHGHRSLLLYPLHVDDQLVGLMELASPNPGDLNAFNARRLVDVVPLFATTLKRNLDELEDHVQALIKRKYTAIHSSVEWRFREAARRYLEQRESGEASPELEQIVFHDVYPLYGLVDMRNSSRIRNEAIRADLGDQLQLALDVINAAGQIRPLPALEEVGYLLAQHLDRIESELRSDDESGVLELLRRDVEPLFGQLETYGSDVAERVSAYREALDPDLNIVYRRRKDFEESVAGLNDAISMTLDAEEERAQAMFPHFFEKFRTDGVDHSIYVGAELHEDGLFDELYLRNLRIWQLMTTCRIEWELARVKTDMAVPLEATHLILVQHQPLSIRFRIDEKRFDVDGAYDIRYEIVKKRIDKAHIRGTSERVTQPGQLAIVYSTASEADEYRRYVEFLQSKGYLGPGLEELELEDLPGISGLKALRVTIASKGETDEATPPDRPSVSEIEAVVSGDRA